MKKNKSDNSINNSNNLSKFSSLKPQSSSQSKNYSNKLPVEKEEALERKLSDISKLSSFTSKNDKKITPNSLPSLSLNSAPISDENRE